MESVPEIDQDIVDLRKMALYNMQLYKKYIKMANNEVGEVTAYEVEAAAFLERSNNLNNAAMSRIMEMHSQKHNNPDTLDLHYLQEGEAVVCLDDFLDTKIMQQWNTWPGNKDLKVITGRGRRNKCGNAKLKAKTTARFKERNLTWSEINPGCLKVEITHKSLLAADLERTTTMEDMRPRD